MFQYFDTEVINNNITVDIWKNFKIEVITNDYSIHVLTEGENLMSISHKYYNTIDNWWIIYLFNNIDNINFSILQNETVIRTIEKHKHDIINFDNLTSKRKLYIKDLIRNYYLLNNNTIDSIILTNNFLTNKNSDLINIFLEYLQSEILIESFYNTKLKIPNIGVVKEMKNKLSEYSKLWKNK